MIISGFDTKLERANIDNFRRIIMKNDLPYLFFGYCGYLVSVSPLTALKNSGERVLMVTTRNLHHDMFFFIRILIIKYSLITNNDTK